MTTLAYLTVADSYSNIELSKYMSEFPSSVEITGAVLISNGSCSLDENSIKMNISIREGQFEGTMLDNWVDISFTISSLKPAAYNISFENIDEGIIVIARKVLHLPAEEVSSQPPSELVDNLALAIVIPLSIGVAIFLLIVVCTVTFLWYRYYSAKRWVKLTTTQSLVA